MEADLAHQCKLVASPFNWMSRVRMARVVVIGGTGTVGSQTVQELVKRGAKVRVMTRSANRIATLPKGVEGVIGSMLAILEFLAAWNEHPKPFVWTATVQMIQKKLARCRQTLEQIQPGCTQPRRRRPTQKLSS